MSYALNLAPDARRAITKLDVDAQEAIFDLLDDLASEVPNLSEGPAQHFVIVSSATTFTYAQLRLIVDRARRESGLVSLRVLID